MKVTATRVPQDRALEERALVRTDLPVRPLSPVTAAPAPAPADPCVIIHFAGHEYVTRESMADLFLRSAGRVVVDGASQSVPLLHEDGVDLLFITPTASVRVTRASGDS